MGVTLERVQNKFACIIGELCNEPDILSQFAIWVDLRIAEYKSKGAISLDCSGENPNPTWLRGFRPLTKERTADNNVPFSRPSNFTNRDSSLSPGHQQLWDQRISSDNGASNSFHRGGVSRKRPSSDFTSSYLSHSDNTISSAKRFNSSDFSQSIIEPTNESLMSIIGADQEPEIIETTTRENADSSEITIVLDNDETDHNLTPPTFTSAPGEITLSEDRGGNSSQTSDDTVVRTWTKTISTTEARNWTLGASYSSLPNLNQGRVQYAPPNVFQFPNMSHHPHTNKVRQRFPNLKNKSAKQTGLIFGAVGTLECWLSQTQGEHRNIENIPPEVFDTYLTDFYFCLKKKDGEEYNPESFVNFRGRLLAFLHEISYPYNIKNSSIFRKSQTAFLKKLHYLRQIWSAEMHNVSPAQMNLRMALLRNEELQRLEAKQISQQISVSSSVNVYKKESTADNIEHLQQQQQHLLQHMATENLKHFDQHKEQVGPEQKSNLDPVDHHHLNNQQDQHLDLDILDDHHRAHFVQKETASLDFTDHNQKQYLCQQQENRQVYLDQEQKHSLDQQQEDHLKQQEQHFDEQLQQQAIPLNKEQDHQLDKEQISQFDQHQTIHVKQEPELNQQSQ